jgi:hypothetical protein
MIRFGSAGFECSRAARNRRHAIAFLIAKPSRRSSNRSHGYSETIAESQIDNSNPWYFRLGVTIINEQAPTRSMRPDCCTFPMAGELKPDFDSPPMFAQARPSSAFRFDKLRNCRLFDYSKAIRWMGDVHHRQPLRLLPMKCHRV